MKATETSAAAGVSMIEASQAVWGKLGWRLIIAGELDNSTIYVYNNYSTSSFSALSTLGSLSTANTILFAVVKPPIAKLSNVIGRGYTLVFCISMYLIAYILMASATNISTYAAGLMLYSIGQSGTNVMTNVIISDITTPRWRGFALGVSYFPFLITPWVSAFIVDSVVAGIGWRWGIGMFAILMPFGASFIITALVFYQHKAKKMGLLASQTKTTISGFCSDIDLGGIVLFVGGFAMLLLPITIAGSLEEGWRTPWVIAVMVVGGVLLIALIFYEKFVAANPVVPVFYFKNATIVLSILMVATDSIGFSCTHTYMYAWASVSHDMSPRNATFYVYTNGVIQCLIGIGAGYIMLVTGRYKWLTMCGVVIRLIGYGVMLRLRGQDNSIAELFIQQVIQGIGSGIIQTTLLVPPQVVVPHSHIALVLALVFSASFLGSSIGSAVAGAIYTNTMRPALWKFLGDSGTQELVDALYNSITDVLPDWGTPERIAINYAYSDVIKGMTYTALGASIPAIIMCFFLPNLALPK
ncbi:MFS general substrate transporter [Thozetella sp. PMI_491]|nr:MFS general substrate transporter [Thozetella sp. PMI_491]